MRLFRLFVLTLVFLVCIAREFGVGVPQVAGASTPRMLVASSVDFFLQQGQPIRSPDTEAGQPGAWPTQGSKRMVDVTALKAEANQLMAMSQTLPAQIDQIGNGKLPKDLIENLKRIEKLSKHIRGEIE